MTAPGALRGIRARSFLIVGIAIAGTVTQSAASGSDACDVGFVRAQVEHELPDYRVEIVRADDGILVLLLARRDRVGTFAVALRASGTRLFTSVMGARLDAGAVARASQSIGSWYERVELQQALARCCAAVPDAVFGEPGAKLQAAVERALASADRGGGLAPRRAIEAPIVVVALALSLAIVLWPAIRRLPRRPAGSGTPRLDVIVVLCAAAVAVAIASTIAWHMGPEGDEIVTLGTRHAALSYLLSWNDGGEPFNPPGSSALFALWLRLSGGFFWARSLSIALIPLTGWVAYRAGAALAGRAVGVSFAGLLILAPAYLRLAAIARAYALIAFALCLLLATITETARTKSHGEWLGVAGLLGLWVSYLLWPLALAAPWIARLDRRHRLRLTAALALTVAALLPRVANGVAAASEKVGTFELRGPTDAFTYALGTAGQAPPQGYSAAAAVVVVWARAIGAGLILIAIVQLWRRDRRQLFAVLLVLALVVAPVLALLSGGHGIRDRHVIGVHVVLALMVATGLGLLIAGSRGAKGRAAGWLLAAGLAAGSVAGNSAVIGASQDGIPALGRLCAGADLVMIAPEDAQGAVYAMLFGDSPAGSEAVRWPPVCELGTEGWCRRIGGLQTVSVDDVSDGVVSAAAASPRSIWIFRDQGEPAGRDIPPRLRRCDQLLQNSVWTILECLSTTLRPD